MTDLGGSNWKDGNLYETALAALEGAISATAVAKNVLIAPGHLAQVAEEAAETLELADHYQLVQADHGACERAADAIHRAIDAHYLLDVGVKIAFAFGEPHAANTYAPAFMNSVIKALHGDGGARQGRVWPPPEQFAAEILTSRPHASLFWRDTDGSNLSLSMRFWNASDSAYLSPDALAREVHHPAGEGPAFRCTDAAGQIVAEMYLEHHKYHRDPAQGPALFRRAQDGGRVRLVTEYWVEGVQHRPSQDGPAVIETDEQGSVLLEIYVEHGKRHRDPAAGPAFYELEEIDGQVGPVFEYWQHGELHHPSPEGPAVRKTDMDGRLLLEVYFERDKRHRDPADGPAFFKHKVEGGEVRLAYQYSWEGEIHRDASQGPAWIETNAAGRVLFEAYGRHGSFHRDDGPAVVHRDESTGALIHEEYWCGGRLHRDDGPAIVCRHADGVIHYEAWCRDRNQRAT